jgi:hypothetical protein
VHPGRSAYHAVGARERRTQGVTHRGRHGSPAVGSSPTPRAPTLGSEPADAITARLYTSNGDTLNYVCELEGDTMTIWMGEKGSPAVYTGTFSADGNTIEGEWEWPGGGYKETMIRARA